MAWPRCCWSQHHQVRGLQQEDVKVAVMKWSAHRNWFIQRRSCRGGGGRPDRRDSSGFIALFLGKGASCSTTDAGADQHSDPAHNSNVWLMLPLLAAWARGQLRYRLGHAAGSTMTV